MQTIRGQAFRVGGVAALLGTILATVGCDPTVKAAVQDGVITGSTSLFASLLTAVVSVLQERPANSNSNSNGNSNDNAPAGGN